MKISGRLSRNLRNLLIWAAILIAIALGYSQFQTGTDNLVSVRGTFMPQHDSSEIPGEASFRANRDGAFVVRALVDGTPVIFLVDTGASQVILTIEDAERLGHSVDSLEFSERFQTANGAIRGAPLLLSELRIGDLEIEDVRASVIRSPMSTSLLGMSFLSRLEGYEVGEEGLILRW